MATSSTTVAAREARLILRYLGNGAVASILAFIAMGLSATLLRLVVPYELGQLTEIAKNSTAKYGLLGAAAKAVLYIAVAQAALFVVLFFKFRTGVTVEQRLYQSLVMDVFRRVLRCPADFFQEHKVESINTRTVEDSRELTSVWGSAVADLPLAAISTLGFMLYMCWYSLPLGALASLLSLLNGFFLLFDRKIQEIRGEERMGRDEIRVTASEVVSGVAELRSHDAFEYGARLLNCRFATYAKTMRRLGTWHGFFSATFDLIPAVQIAAILGCGAWLCQQNTGALDWGGVVSLLWVTTFSMPSAVQGVFGFVLQWRLSRPCYKRICEFLDYPVAFDMEGTNAPRSPDGIEVVLRDVCVRTRAGDTILNGVNVTIPRGKRVALRGPNGCGKSTAMRLLVRGIAPSSGDILLDGKNIDRCEISWLARNVGYLPQEPILFDTSIRQNLLLGLRRHGIGNDEEGPLDLESLSECERTSEGVDTALVRVVRAVNLEDDVLKKALDGRLPTESGRKESFRALRERIGELRKAVQRRMTGNTRDALVRFDHVTADGYRDDLTLRDNLLLGRIDQPQAEHANEVDGTIRDALRAMTVKPGGTDAILRLVILAGLEYRVGPGGSGLSGGQKKKVAIGRVLLKNSKLLLLDEMSASLDDVSENAMIKELRSLRDTTLISIDHVPQSRIPQMLSFDFDYTISIYRGIIQPEHVGPAPE